MMQDFLWFNIVPSFQFVARRDGNENRIVSSCSFAPPIGHVIHRQQVSSHRGMQALGDGIEEKP